MSKTWDNIEDEASVNKDLLSELKELFCLEIF